MVDPRIGETPDGQATIETPIAPYFTVSTEIDLVVGMETDFNRQYLPLRAQEGFLNGSHCGFALANEDSGRWCADHRGCSPHIRGAVRLDLAGERGVLRGDVRCGIR